jgi:hypothetical protein
MPPFPAFSFPSTTATLVGVLDFLAEPFYLGSASLGIALLLAGLAGRTSKKHDFPADTPWLAKIRALSKQPNWNFLLLIVFAGLFIVLGNVLIRRAGSQEAREMSRKAAEREDRAQEVYREILATVKPRSTPENTANANGNTSPASENAEDPYEKWAQEFWTNRGNLVVSDIDLSKLSAEEFRTAMSLRWWSVLESARDTIEKAIAKYNERAPTKAVAKLQQLPKDFGNTYGVELGTVEFASAVNWRIEVRVPGPPKIDLGPVLCVDIPRGRPGAKERAGSLYVNFFNSGEFDFQNYVYGLARKPRILDQRYSMEKFEDAFRNAILELLKAQALLLDAAGPE